MPNPHPRATLADHLHGRIAEAVDTYRGPVPVGECIRLAMDLGPVTFRAYTEHNQDWLCITLADRTQVVISLED